MIQQISEHIDSVLSFTGYIAKYFPLVELKSDGDKTFPAEYTGRGQFRPLPNNFDNFNGMAYLRMNGNGVSSELENTNRVCAIELSMSYPLRLVYCIPRKKLKLDTPFSAEGLAGDLIRLITLKNGALKTSLKAVSVSLISESWIIDPVQLYAEEYAGIQSFDVNYEFIYGAINFIATIQINKDCIPDSCVEACYG